MYEEHWNLKEKPFKNTPDPKFLCSFPQYADALMKLTYTVRENMGAGLLTGVYGCGKTLIVRKLISSLSTGKYMFAPLITPPSSPGELLRAVVRSLKSAELPMNKTELMEDALLEILQNVFSDNAREGKEAVIIVDEAHSIKDERIFEEIRLLLNFQKDDRFLLTLLMIGQPELAGKIANLRQLEQRVAIRCHLEPLSADQMEEYIVHRLKVAGRKKPVFKKEVFPSIYKLSGGIPRRVNHICDLCLMTGFARKKDSIDLEIFQEYQKIFGGSLTPEGNKDEGVASFN